MCYRIAAVLLLVLALAGRTTAQNNPSWGGGGSAVFPPATGAGQCLVSTGPGTNYVAGPCGSGNLPALGAAGTILVQNAAGNAAAWVACTGDATCSAVTPGAFAIVKIRGNAVKSGTPTDAQFYIWNSTNTDFEPVSMSGDVAITNTGATTAASVHIPGGSPGNLVIFNSVGNLVNYGGSATPAGQYATAVSPTGILTASQVGCGQLTGAAAHCGTAANELTTGVVAAAQGGAGTSNGLLKANGSGLVSVAAAKTDYLPATSGSAIQKADGLGGLIGTTPGTDYAVPPNGTANTPLFNNGTGGFTNGTSSGNTTTVATFSGAATAARCLHTDANGNVVITASDCAAGAGGTPGYINTPTVTSGAVTLQAQCTFAGCTDFNNVANGSNAGALTITPPLTSGMTAGQLFFVYAVDSGTAPSDVVFGARAGVTYQSYVMGLAAADLTSTAAGESTKRANACGAPAATGVILYRFWWDGINLSLTNCNSNAPPPVLSVALGGNQCGLAGLMATTLPASPALATRCGVTNASACIAGTALNTGVTGSTFCEVVWNGTNWQPAGGAIAPATGGFSTAGTGLTGVGSTISLTTPVTVANGGTGTATPALVAGTGISLSGSFPAQTVNLSTPVSVANGGTGGATAATARSNLSAAASGVNGDITSLTGLTTALSTAQGGTECPQTPTLTLAQLNTAVPSPHLGTQCVITDCQTGVSGTTEAGGGSIVCSIQWMGANWIDGGVASGGAGGGSVLSATTRALPYYSAGTSISGASAVYYAINGDDLHTIFQKCPTQGYATGIAIGTGGTAITDTNNNVEWGQCTAGTCSPTPTTTGSAPSWTNTGLGQTVTSALSGGATVTWHNLGKGTVASSPCTVIALPGSYTLSTALLLGFGGASSSETLVISSGATLKPTDAGGTGHAGVVVANKGTLRGTDQQSSSISAQGSASLDAVVESSCAYQHNLTPAMTNIGCPNMDVQNLSMTDGSATIGVATLWVGGVEGLGTFNNLHIICGQTGDTCVRVDDVEGQWNALMFNNDWLQAQQANPTGIGYDIECGADSNVTGGSQSLQIIGGAIVDFTGSSTTSNLTTPTYMKVHGDSGHSCYGVLVYGTYFETNGGSASNSGGRLIDLTFADNFEADGIVFNGGKAPGGNAINIASGGNVRVQGKCESNSCGSGIKLINNAVTGYSLTPGAQTSFNYYWSGNANGALTVDQGTANGIQNAFGPGPTGSYNSAASDPLPTCSSTYAREFVCVADATACTSGTTYVGGASTACLVECNNAGNAWKETGINCQ